MPPWQSTCPALDPQEEKDLSPPCESMLLPFGAEPQAAVRGQVLPITTCNAQKSKLAVVSTSPPISLLLPLLRRQVSPFDHPSLQGNCSQAVASPRGHLDSLAFYCGD